MDRLIALVMLFFTLPAFATSSTVVYPNFTGLTQTTVGGQTVQGAKTGATVLSNGTVRFPYGGRLFAGLEAANAAAFGPAITARAPVVQSTAKILATQTLKNLALGGVVGILGAWALEKGLQYVNGQWQKGIDQYQPDGHFTPQGIQNFLNQLEQNTGNLFSNSYPGLHIDYCVSGTYVFCKLLYANGDTYGTVNMGLASEFNLTSSQSPATQSDFDDLANQGRDLSQAELQALIDAGWIAPVSGPTTVIGDLSGLTNAELADLTAAGFFEPAPGVGAVPVGDPVTNPVTGQKKQPYVQLEPAPNAGVRVTPYEQPLNPDGTPATDAQGNPLPNQEREADPCELDPYRAGCATMGDLDDATPESSTTPVSLTPHTPWGGSGQCPAPANLSFLGQPLAFEFTPACNFFTAMNPVVIAAAWVGAILIFIGGVKGQEA